MGTKYRHLTEQDRIFLSIMITKGYKKSKIAEILGVHRSTIYREIKRNENVRQYKRPYSELKVERYYSSFLAQRKYLSRRKRPGKLSQDKLLRQYIHSKLLKGWSPKQIEGRLKRENEGNCLISHETIYRYIYSDYGIRNRFYQKLRRKHFLRIKRGSRKPRVPIDLLIYNRSDTINNREEFGHWECDLMIFKRGIKANLITLRERTSRFLIAIKNLNKTASGTALALISTVKKIKPYIKSITFDQGSEFQKYEWIKGCLNTDIYFCKPASPYQKGSIENGNGDIRVELPRSTNLDELKQRTVSNIIKQINERPLKCLDYLTPVEQFSLLTKEVN